MKAQELKQGVVYNKSVMYWFDCSRDITVEETQQDNTVDKAILHYTVSGGDKAYFSEEYLPAGMSKEGIKKPDITAILENSVKKRVKWYIYDMKDTVIHSKTAMKLCNQWHSGIEHIESQYLNSLEGYNIESSLGVIYRYWSREMLQKDKESYEEKINLAGRNGLLTARKSGMKQNEYRQKVKAIQFILDGVFVDDKLSDGKGSYVIDFVCMNTTDRITYMAELDIKF